MCFLARQFLLSSHDCTFNNSDTFLTLFLALHFFWVLDFYSENNDFYEVLLSLPQIHVRKQSAFLQNVVQKCYKTVSAFMNSSLNNHVACWSCKYYVSNPFHTIILSFLFVGCGLFFFFFFSADKVFLIFVPVLLPLICYVLLSNVYSFLLVSFYLVRKMVNEIRSKLN